ncbi:adenosylcobinamide kinase /adenosylcobinamide-phosphate guanylyltransferase [Oribacterium sp. KHPX15]|uniref:bifunctional adenosylcobinamide kinase/adenosylcobinamide-phosphate guanylyltransferase n=1 Tax=Oribacterium sp. KHPX15 TaxID=1855342 RepID=UPI000894E727|nr:bifunctional adenosylcobinamide kinase/adenosylcobinamide-phosphate guanylyltransferase [Oribacterium sp. KHPX15]SEA48856.1 adenosylcobinamide kinase /adenosylcobinamide-phosphate guanylyltransferase [Oribacterium sp. KHPX15]
MVLIIGGMCQGKHDFCKSEFPDAEVIEHYEERIREELGEGKGPVSEAEKWLDEISATMEIDGTDTAVHLSMDSENRFKEQNPRELVIIMNEVGSGVVPMDKDEREWREAAGRVSCLFAKRADRVYRLLAGIPQRLK